MALALAALAAVEPACGSGYQQLQNEEEPGEREQTAGGTGDAPPPYSSITAESAGQESHYVVLAGLELALIKAYFDYKDESGFPKPPSYNVATTLPSYDEAERTKTEATIPLVPGRDEDFVGRDDFDDADQLRIGNDGIFMLTFFMAFLFNWIGFFLSFCLTTSAAGRYGAISGFGLSLIKWILIVRFSTYFPGYFDGQYWLWWVFLVLGLSPVSQRIYQLRKSSEDARNFLKSPQDQSSLYLLKMCSGVASCTDEVPGEARAPAGSESPPE
ncbi:NEDD4 family-interacting protein 1 [Apodemus speciosus]|uniref:NEDD4 family-interacting protein 1 n=1 Tax=Apodemus speciosus TaxID=105296 RepID=A0ABQ0FQZ7_APOSI